MSAQIRNPPDPIDEAKAPFFRPRAWSDVWRLFWKGTLLIAVSVGMSYLLVLAAFLLMLRLA